VFLFMDQAGSYDHNARLEHQATYFSTTTANLWVVSLWFRLDNFGIIEDGEKARLLAQIERLKMPPVIRELRLFYSQYLK